MADRIVFADGKVFACPANNSVPVSRFNREREGRRILVLGTAAEADEYFVDNASYRHEWDSETYDENGNITGTEVLTQDLSAFSVAGDIVDKRDGSLEVYMGKPTELELLQEQLTAAEAAMAEGVNSIDG